MATADDNSGEKDYALNRKKEIINRLRFPFMITALLALVIGSVTASLVAHFAEITTWLPLMLAKSAGIGLGFLLMIEHIDKHNPIVNKICGFSPKTSCEEVTESPVGTLFGFSMAEVALFYFTGGFLALAFSLFITDLQTVFLFLALLNLTTLPYSLFSIVYQAAVIKKWCPLCVGVMALFWVECVIFISTLSFEMPPITVGAISLILWGFLLPPIIWAGFKPSIKATRQIPSLKKAVARFKSSPRVLDALLSQAQSVSTEKLAGDILFGDPDSPITIIMITSPFCGSCASAYHELRKLLNEFPEEFKVLVRILDSGKQAVTQRLLTFSDNPEMADQALQAWYIQKDKPDTQAWLQQFVATEPAAQETIEKRLDEIADWCKANNVLGTPTFFINGQKLPRLLKISDAKNYLEAQLDSAVKVDFSKSAFSVCQFCGLCCNGTLFTHGKLKAEEVTPEHQQNWEAAGLKIQLVKEGKWRLLLPCDAFQDNRCQCYDSKRPDVCITFGCGLLQRYSKDDLPLQQALDLLQNIQARLAEVLAGLSQSQFPSDNPALSFHERTNLFEKHYASLPPDARSQYEHVMLKQRALLKLLSINFRQ